uniref:Uncharacterized protein n=1 Tax=Hordeum vulgare subsp. vulgare TaxID=112509 RepID=A0A8I7BA24_HORVV
MFAHGTTNLHIVYMKDMAKVKVFLSMFGEWLQEEKHKFMDLDLEYTTDGRDVAVVQLCFKQCVTVFQWASSDKHCPKLMEFLRSSIYFASIDITNDKIKMRHTWGIEIPAECHVDLHGRFRLEPDKTSMAHMAAVLIDGEYTDMNTKFPKPWHKLWEKTPLDPINIEYAAIDGYVAYELYLRIGICNYGQRHLVPLVSPTWGYFDLEDEYCLQWQTLLSLLCSAWGLLIRTSRFAIRKSRIGIFHYAVLYVMDI